MLKAFQDMGDLDRVLTVKNELTRFSTTETLSENDFSGSLPELRSLQIQTASAMLKSKAEAASECLESAKNEEKELTIKGNAFREVSVII